MLCVFQMGVSRLLWLTNLFGEVVGGTACFLRVSCQTLPFTSWCKFKCYVPHVPNDDIHSIPFSLKAGAPVRCGISVSFFWGWQLGWCVTPDVRNRDVCEVRRMSGTNPCHWSFFFHLAEVCMKLGAAQLSLPNASLNDLSSLLFVQGSPYTQWGNPITLKWM